MIQPCLFEGVALRPNWPFQTLEPWSYDLIMADPPWRFELWSDKGEEKSAQAQYDCMALVDIAALPVSDLAATDCLLWLWATSPMLPQALDIMAAWHFEYCTMGFWHKTTVHGKTAFGTGYRLRSAGEPFLIGIRGNPTTSRSVRNVISGLARGHSRKPEAAYGEAEKLVNVAGGRAVRRADLFSRQRRVGWDAWGNETDKFGGTTNAAVAQKGV